MKITKRDHELIGLIITPCEHSSKCGNKWRVHHFGQSEPTPTNRQSI
jgi:hypothetical protein